MIIPAANFTDDVITKCAEGIASIEIPWPEDFSLIINFVAVSDVTSLYILLLLLLLFYCYNYGYIRTLNNLGILAV